MIIRGTPKNINDYIKVDKYKAMELQRQGYFPTYIDSQYIYFRKGLLNNGDRKNS